MNNFTIAGINITFFFLSAILGGLLCKKIKIKDNIDTVFIPMLFWQISIFIQAKFLNIGQVIIGRFMNDPNLVLESYDSRLIKSLLLLYALSKSMQKISTFIKKEIKKK